MSTCDSCRDPGHCCRSFRVDRHFKPETTRAEVTEHLRNGTDDFSEGTTYEVLPFDPQIRNGGFYAWPNEEVPHSVMWTFSCPKLGADGRCTIYDTRPELCQTFEPKSVALCIEYDVKPEDITSYVDEPVKDLETIPFTVPDDAVPIDLTKKHNTSGFCTWCQGRIWNPAGDCPSLRNPHRPPTTKDG